MLAAGLTLIVLEEGGYYNEADFNQLELAMMRKLYYQGGFAATADAAIALIAGACLGGGTVINYTTSFRSPDWLRREWTATSPAWSTIRRRTRSLIGVGPRSNDSRRRRSR